MTRKEKIVVTCVLLVNLTLGLLLSSRAELGRFFEPARSVASAQP